MMRVSATQKHARMSPRKIRPYARMIQGMGALDAKNQLTFAKGKAPVIILHVLNSAIANATNNLQMAPSELKVASVLVNPGLVMKRFMPVAKGMAHPILKRTAHVTVVVEGEPQKDGKVKKAKPIATVTADEFVAQGGHDHAEEVQEVTETKATKKESAEDRTKESVEGKQNYTAFQKTKMNQQGGDAKKTHRRKSIG